MHWNSHNFQKLVKACKFRPPLSDGFSRVVLTVWLKVFVLFETFVFYSEDFLWLHILSLLHDCRWRQFMPVVTYEIFTLHKLSSTTVRTNFCRIFCRQNCKTFYRVFWVGIRLRCVSYAYKLVIRAIASLWFPETWTVNRRESDGHSSRRGKP